MTGLRGGCRQGWGTNGSPVRLRQAEKPTAGSVSCSEPTPKAWHRNPQARNHKKGRAAGSPGYTRWGEMLSERRGMCHIVL